MTAQRSVAGKSDMVASPCINLCKMEDGLCAGCLRTIDEIARWAHLGDDSKHLILAAVEQRRSGLDADRAAPHR